MHKVAICGCRAATQVAAAVCAHHFPDDQKCQETQIIDHKSRGSTSVLSCEPCEILIVTRNSRNTSEEMSKLSKKSSVLCSHSSSMHALRWRSFFLHPSKLTVLWNAEVKPQEELKTSCLPTARSPCLGTSKRAKNNIRCQRLPSHPESS